MVDLAPEGAISLTGFYDRYRSWNWHGHFPFDELRLGDILDRLPQQRIQMHRAGEAAVTDHCLTELTRLFQAGIIGVFVCPVSERDRRYISGKAWDTAFFPERMFLADTIGAGHGAEFDAAIGRTPFVWEKDSTDALEARARFRKDAASVRSTRELLIGLVMDGVLGSHQAENYAKAWGLESFATLPPKGKYEPMREAVWTLPMALAWLVWRDLDKVREAMDGYRADTWDWFGYFARVPLDGGASWYEVEGEELKQLDPVSMFSMGLSEAFDRQLNEDLALMTVKAAREDLWRQLAEATLIATGLTADSKVAQIPSHEWPYISLEADRKGMDRLMLPDQHGPAYRHVTLRRVDVMTVWPAWQREKTVQHFNLGAPVWTLLAAAIWTGSKGKQLSSQEVADGNLEEHGGYDLFAVLNVKKLFATGLNAARIREAIPAEYWEVATLDPMKAGKQHYVSFIDDILEEEGGQFTPFGEHKPRWFGIRISRDDLFRTFPDYAPTEREVAPASSSRSSARKFEAAKDAIRAVFADGFPVGVGDKQRLDKVNDWLRRDRNIEVSLATLARAERALR